MINFTQMNQIKNIAVLTSGGDAPGMNAAIRAVVKTGLTNNLNVFGVYEGYFGMITNQIEQLEKHDVSGILHHGGTILKTARSKEFKTIEGRKKAYENLKKHHIHGVIAIGGDGTFTGASLFSEEHDIPCIGIPATIDNDIFGTEYTIGYDTAKNTIIDVVDKIKDTANSHNRIFFVEVMGRHSGYLALESGIACGAEAILIPEIENQVCNLISFLKTQNRKHASIIIVAEGDEEGQAYEIAAKVKDQIPKLEERVSVLGHIQRGGSPTAIDRVYASLMGVASVEALLNKNHNIMIGMKNNKIIHFALRDTAKKNSRIPDHLIHAANELI